MTDTVMLAIVGGIPATLAAFGTLIVSIRNGGKTDSMGKKLDETHAAVNHNLDDLKEQLSAAEKRAANLERILMTMVASKPEHAEQVDTIMRAERHIQEKNPGGGEPSV